MTHPWEKGPQLTVFHRGFFFVFFSSRHLDIIISTSICIIIMLPLWTQNILGHSWFSQRVLMLKKLVHGKMTLLGTYLGICLRHFCLLGFGILCMYSILGICWCAANRNHIHNAGKPKGSKVKIQLSLVPTLNFHMVRRFFFFICHFFRFRNFKLLIRRIY